jgi:hypothetical protein
MEYLGKLGIHLYTDEDNKKLQFSLPHVDDGDSMFSYIIWFSNIDCLKPYLIISQVLVMMNFH